MNNTLVAVAASFAFAALSTSALAQPASIKAALADPGRPAADVARDMVRKPAEVVAFAKIRPGDTVTEVLPGGGYFTRIFSKVVGSSGHVTAVAPAMRDQDKGIKAIAADPAYANVTPMDFSKATMGVWPKADVMFTAQNYHDFHLKVLHLDVPATDKALFDAVKPGGYLIVEDHVAATGAPIETADTLHRIDPAIARKELEAAGFVFDGESDTLRSTADDHTLNVFNPAIRGKTDQFLYRFKRPA